MPSRLETIANRSLDWAIDHGLKVLIIIAGTYLVLYLIRLLSKRIVAYSRKAERDQDQGEREKRTETLVHIFETTGKVFIIIIAIFMVMKELGMDITPLLTGAGIAGLALGFGAQSLVKDFLSGFFILIENQFRVGDVIKIGEFSGVVERISLRTVVLRDLGGNVHVIPNGEVKAVTNMSYEWSRAVVDIGVSYREDVDRVMNILEDVGKSMMEDATLKEVILEKPVVIGINDFGDSQVKLQVLVKTVPLKQWEVGRDLRKRIKAAFDREGIESRSLQQIVITKET
ncbi:MAG: mechanosensitive ion channel family protein [Proteobacteria bacterium]|nr:mechanosensitive ion channel family protein [Pseudomonadota bacterium]